MERYNSLFNEAIKSEKEAHERVYKLEQMKGIAYAIGVVDMLINEIEELKVKGE